MSRVLVLHAYSAANRGDGLLVDETIRLVRDALGPGVEVTVCASWPETFAYLGVRVLSARPTLAGYDRQYVRALRAMGSYDLVVGVGGGYLRAGHLREALKAALVHGPQLYAASRSNTRTVYLPQSIGPLKMGTRRLARRLLSRIDVVYVRDDRSLSEVGPAIVTREPDLALTCREVQPEVNGNLCACPVLSVRAVRGVLPEGVAALAGRLGEYTIYVQSTTSGNDDRPVSAALDRGKNITYEELTDPHSERRVVIAVRLHAAIMSIMAGHYVVHLAYERKGFAAFADLGLGAYVHNLGRFSVEDVAKQVSRLIDSPDERRAYEEARDAGLAACSARRGQLLEALSAQSETS